MAPYRQYQAFPPKIKPHARLLPADPSGDFENFHEAERIVHKNIDVSTLEFEDDDEYIFPVDEDEDDPDEEYEEYWDDDEDEDTRK